MKKNLLMFLSFIWLIQAKADVTITLDNFPDEKFCTYLLGQSYGKDGLITNDEIAKIKRIAITSAGVKSMKGIEYFTALEHLECGANQLTTLDVSKNTALQMLFCEGNQLTALDISGCENLGNLACYNNQLTSIDLSNSIALYCLTITNNNLTELDLSRCTNMTYLYCGYNKLTALDLSKNTVLKELECSNNLLTSLDISQCKEITNLNCDHNQLKTLDFSTNTMLTSIFCFRNHINGSGMDALVESLPTLLGFGKLAVIFNENEDNVITTNQVAVAKAKGWTPEYFDGENWQEYDGSNSLGINCTSVSIKTEREWFDLKGNRVKIPKKGIFVKHGEKIYLK